MVNTVLLDRGLPTPHAYTVLTVKAGTQATQADAMVTLRNPWGNPTTKKYDVTDKSPLFGNLGSRTQCF